MHGYWASQWKTKTILIMNKYYAGIGSRRTPPKILEEMARLAAELETRGWWLRSGGAGGADEAFQSGVKQNAQIWLPWPTFAQATQEKCPQHEYKWCAYNDTPANESVNQFHPAPDRLSRGGFALMRRNYRQIVGHNEPNSSFVICWTEGGLKKGGTAQAIKIAESFNIPVFNMFDLTGEEILNKIEDTNEN